MENRLKRRSPRKAQIHLYLGDEVKPPREKYIQNEETDDEDAFPSAPVHCLPPFCPR